MLLLVAAALLPAMRPYLRPTAKPRAPVAVAERDRVEASRYGLTLAKSGSGGAAASTSFTIAGTDDEQPRVGVAERGLGLVVSGALPSLAARGERLDAASAP